MKSYESDPTPYLSVPGIFLACVSHPPRANWRVSALRASWHCDGGGSGNLKDIPKNEIIKNVQLKTIEPRGSCALIG